MMTTIGGRAIQVVRSDHLPAGTMYVSPDLYDALANGGQAAEQARENMHAIAEFLASRISERQRAQAVDRHLVDTDAQLVVDGFEGVDLLAKYPAPWPSTQVVVSTPHAANEAFLQLARSMLDSPLSRSVWDGLDAVRLGHQCGKTQMTTDLIEARYQHLRQADQKTPPKPRHAKGPRGRWGGVR